MFILRGIEPEAIDSIEMAKISSQQSQIETNGGGCDENI